MKSQNYKKAQTKTYPWDGDIEDTRHHLVWFSLLFTALFLLLFQTSNAQKIFIFPTPDDPNIEKVELEEQLSRSELQTAKDYQEIISELEFLIRNHLEYFSEFKKFEGQKYQNLLLNTLLNIEKGKYCIDVDQLTNDLSLLKSSLKDEEIILKNDKSLHKLYKNVRTLRYDLENIEDILKEDIAEQIKDHKSSLHEIKIYLQKEREENKHKEEYQIQMYELQELLNDEVMPFLTSSESLNITIDESKIRELVESKKLLKELEEVLNFVITLKMSDSTMEISAPNLHTPPTPPTLPSPLDQVKKIHEYNYEGAIALSHEYQDSIIVKSKKLPIYISNQLGNLEVRGWDRNKVVAKYAYKVTADTYEDTKEFLESITLDMTSDQSGIHITSDFPSLHNTKRQVINSSMVLYIPKNNILEITNSFGRTDVSNFKNNINITTKNSDVIVDNITGNVISSGKNGSILLHRVSGGIDVTSNRGKVTVENVNSKITITNSHAPIIITDCTGDTYVENSGEITVNNHTGNLEIENKNGKTIVQTLTGNLTLSGSFQPLIINSVIGSVEVENKNSLIDISKISGESIVQNQSGMIKAQEIDGPIDFSNDGGEIYFIASSSMLGNSSIRSDYGTINIILPKLSNILLSASTDGGSIKNSYLTKVEKDDFLSSTTIALGDKSKRLDVSGINATIIIKDSK